MTEETKARSSNIKYHQYDPVDNTLTIEFNNGGKYCYHKVPEEIYQKFVDSESWGKYLHAIIKPQFKCIKVVQKEDK